jgi:hypothetical protein
MLVCFYQIGVYGFYLNGFIILYWIGLDLIDTPMLKCTSVITLSVPDLDAINLMEAQKRTNLHVSVAEVQ